MMGWRDGSSDVTLSKVTTHVMTTKGTKRATMAAILVALAYLATLVIRLACPRTYGMRQRMNNTENQEVSNLASDKEPNPHAAQRRRARVTAMDQEVVYDSEDIAPIHTLMSANESTQLPKATESKKERPYTSAHKSANSKQCQGKIRDISGPEKSTTRSQNHMMKRKMSRKMQSMISCARSTGFWLKSQLLVRMVMTTLPTLVAMLVDV
jgi:hypothetical protein